MGEKFKIKTIILYKIRIFLYYFFRIFPIQNNKIFIQNFNGKGYGDNPKYIVEEIIRRKLLVNIVFSVADKYNTNFPNSVKTVRYGSIRSIYEEVTAKVWIDNCRKQLYVRKRKKQFYIQTWHGIPGTKKVEKDVEQQLSDYYVKQAKHDSTLINLFLSDSKFTSQLYRTSFWYIGEIFENGSPRNDILINTNLNIITKIQKYFMISPDERIVLYAPTFRNNFDINVYKIDFEHILNDLQKKTNEHWIFLLRLHPNITEKSNIYSYNESILNASDYDDMQELLLASDILITDYSSSMYDFSLMYKPAFLYIKDYEEYLKERGFYFDLVSLPFPCALDNNELLKNILYFDNESYMNSLEVFFQKIGIVKDGNASKKIVDRIIKEIES
jgi:CDP-glycerol glycerophosphotransferase